MASGSGGVVTIRTAKGNGKGGFTTMSRSKARGRAYANARRNGGFAYYAQY